MKTIKIHALRQRVNRVLGRQGCVMRAHGWEHGCCGTYVVWRRVDGKTMLEIAAHDLIGYAREIGAMKPWEADITTLLDDAGREVLPPGAVQLVPGDAPAAAAIDIGDLPDEMLPEMPDLPGETP